MPSPVERPSEVVEVTRVPEPVRDFPEAERSEPTRFRRREPVPKPVKQFQRPLRVQLNLTPETQRMLEALIDDVREYSAEKHATMADVYEALILAVFTPGRLGEGAHRMGGDMGFRRRSVLRLLTGVAIGSGLGGIVRPRASAAILGLRTVSPTDVLSIRSIINQCVTDEGAFHGKCGDWSAEWATEFIARSPNSVVLTLGGAPVAFQEVPTVRRHLLLSPQMPRKRRALDTRSDRRIVADFS